MIRSVQNIFWLATKELYSFLSDYVMLALMVYSFTLAIISSSHNTAQEVHNATVAIADEEKSELSRAIALDFLPPYFKPADYVATGDIDRLLDTARYTFVVDIPPHMSRDAQAGRTPTIQLNVDATAVMQAGIGSSYMQQIIAKEATRHIMRTDEATPDPVSLAVHLAYNPDAEPGWFLAVMSLVNNIGMLAIVLCGAAVIREREGGTMDHLLTMPLSPNEIAAAKVLANGFVVFVASSFSIYGIIRGILAVPIAGSIPLFLLGVGLYLFSALAVGLFLATIAHSMPQFGLLFLLVYVPMNLLSGSNTPIESEPRILQILMQGVGSTHFVSFAEAILFRGAGLSTVWPSFAAVTVIGAIFFTLAVARFRRVSATVGG